MGSSSMLMLKEFTVFFLIALAWSQPAFFGGVGSDGGLHLHLHLHSDVDASTGEKLQDRELSLSGGEDEKCSTDEDCKKNCASGYLCSCNKGTCENNKGEKTLRVPWGHNLLHGSGIAGGTYGEGYANSNFGNGVGSWGCEPLK